MIFTEYVALYLDESLTWHDGGNKIRPKNVS